MPNTQNKPAASTPPAHPIPTTNTAPKAAAKPAPKTYHGKPISSIRDAITGDPGFNGTAGQQVVITLADGGTEKTVMKHDLKG